MEKGFHDIEQFIAFITPGHTAFHERPNKVRLTNKYEFTALDEFDYGTMY